MVTVSFLMCQHLRRSLMQFLRGYTRLAQFCLGRNMRLFGMVPKLHALSHFRRDLDEAILRSDPHVVNAALFDNSMAEDFIGQISRRSRRIGFKKHLFERHLLKSYLLKTKIAIRRFKTKNTRNRELNWDLWDPHRTQDPLFPQKHPTPA